MRAVALAIVLAGAGIERAIRNEPEALRGDRKAAEALVGLLFLVCLVFGW